MRLRRNVKKALKVRNCQKDCYTAVVEVAQNIQVNGWNLYTWISRQIEG